MAELIGHGAALDALDQYGWSSLMLAAYAGKLEACKLLLEQGADPHIKTSNGKNARSLSWDAGHKSIAVYISKFVARGSLSLNLSSNRPIAQPLLPAPKSPSRRTHSPAPSLPSVPEEYQEDDNHRTRYSFSGHTSTVSRHSAISSRFASPPTTLRRAPAITVPPPSSPPEPKQESLLLSGSQTATVTNLATMFDVPTPEPAPLEIAEGGPSHSIEISPIEPREVATTHEEHGRHHRPQTSVHTTHKLRRKGIIPRYGSRCLTFCPESTVALTDPERTSLHHHQTSKASEQRTEQMEERLNSHTHGRHIQHRRRLNRAWSLVTKSLTICCPPGIFPRGWASSQIQDWHSKVSICVLVALISVLFGFLAFGISLFTCRPPTQTILASDFYARFGSEGMGSDTGRFVSIHGAVYDLNRLFEQGLHPPMPANLSQTDLSKSLVSRYGTDVSFLFPPSDGTLSCQLYGAANSFGLCSAAPTLDHCHNNSQTTSVLQNILRSDIVLQYRWDMISSDRSLLVFDGDVLDVTDYLSQSSNTSITFAEKALMDWIRSMVGKDATMALQKRSDHKDLEKCLVAYFKVGEIFGQTNGCVASIMVDSLALALWLLLALMRLGSALVYRWVLIRAKGSSGKEASEDMPKHDPPVLMLVRCRETNSEQDIRATLDSLAISSLGSHGLFVVVVESDIGGQTLNNASQICQRLMETGSDLMDDKEGKRPDLHRLSLEVPSVDPRDLGRVVADQHQIFSGHYTVHSKRVPFILIIRSISGGRSSVDPSFRDTKRLMFQFLLRSFYDLPMSFFEFSLFERIRQLTGHRPERYEFLLTTEVGTITDRGSLEQMCQTLGNNDRIVAVCGQRLFQNRTESWLTSIQDYGNFLENQFDKSFESTLGAVQGLPDDLCLIRIKMKPSITDQDTRTHDHKRNSRDTSNLSDTDGEDDGLGLGPTNGAQDDGEKDDPMLAPAKKEKDMNGYRYSVPILVHPAVANVYCASQNTLHQRRMVSYSREDWFLTGLLHAAFPSHRIVYLPQATYRTRATKDFRTYFGQQRAMWSSRVHSLGEQMITSNQAPRTGIFRFWLHAFSLLKLLLMPAVLLSQWILIILVAVGAAQGSSSATLLDSPPAIITLAFLTLVMVYKLILGVFLMRAGTMNLTGLGLTILVLPLWYLVVPFSAIWSSEGMETNKCDFNQ